MAKSARASVLKANRSAFRKNISGPREQARAERLHAKLAEVIAQPKPVRDEKMELEDGPEATKSGTRDATETVDGDIEIVDAADAANGTENAASNTHKKSKKLSRVQKNRRQKARNQMTFKSLDRRAERRKGKK